MTEPIRHTFEAADGVPLTYYELGSGRPLVLVHGYMLPALPSWIDTGIAARIAGDQRRLIMPDMRGHGASVPVDGDAYPPDALTIDLLALLAQLELDEYDLGGYSLGGRVVARALALGARPDRAFIGGTGLDPIVHAVGRGGNYKRILSNLDGWAPGTAEAQFAGYVRMAGGDPPALMRVFDTFVDTPEEDLARVQVPTLVIAGESDTERGSVEALAALLPNGRFERVPGDHYSALTLPELSERIAAFLNEPR